MSRVLIIGAGGVGSVVAHKCSRRPEVFENICLASRTLSKCDRIAAALPRPIETARLDADVPENTIRLIERFHPDLVLNVALPYQDLAIMEACLATGVHYLDTANYEPPDTARFEYRWQWEYDERFRDRGIMALLGSGFDPGVTNVFCAWALKHRFERIEEIDIIDCNAGDHGQPFATNFNPEINIREVTAPGRYYRNGEWIETPALKTSREYTLPDTLGSLRIYQMYHEELESLARHIPGLKQARFWMSFSDNYLKHLEVLQNVGMTRIDPVPFEGREIVPLKFLKALLPDPASLGPLTHGATCIGCQVRGVGKDGNPATIFIYNVCEHERCYREVGAQAISYTTGTPAAIGAEMILRGTWFRPGVYNMEQFDPDPFMEALSRQGLPWKVLDREVLHDR